MRRHFGSVVGALSAVLFASTPTASGRLWIATCKFPPSLSGRIIVSDSNNQCVQCFGPNGELRLKFGSRGRSPGQLQRPTGVCALPNGNFAVADYENRVVSVFDATGPKC